MCGQPLLVSRCAKLNSAHAVAANTIVLPMLEPTSAKGIVRHWEGNTFAAIDLILRGKSCELGVAV